jgi:hypothetical protein
LFPAWGQPAVAAGVGDDHAVSREFGRSPGGGGGPRASTGSIC